MRAVIVTFLVIACLCDVVSADEAEAVIQAAELNPTRPFFIPTHPRVTTTVRFPDEIGAPDGALTVFTEDTTNSTAEYLITWQQGDAYFTITPLNNARLANLNVPFRGRTYVLFFYPVADQLKAVAAVNLTDTSSPAAGPAPRAGTGPGSTSGAVSKQMTAPADPYVPATPARLLGFLDRLKLIHATPVGAELASLAQAMNVEIAVGHSELNGKTPQGNAVDGIAGEIAGGLSDAGMYQILLLRAVRDRRMNCIGFICLVRNTSDQPLAFDVGSFGARTGAEYLGQRVSDASPILKPGEQAAAYFVVQPGRSTPLLATNEWRVSVDLVSPRVNPGAAIARGYTTEGASP